ncbi:hypothetical protein JCM10550A_15630 [Methanogenium cariaci]|jgi:hypothetical protein
MSDNPFEPFYYPNPDSDAWYKAQYPPRMTENGWCGTPVHLSVDLANNPLSEPLGGQKMMPFKTIMAQRAQRTKKP